MKNDDISAFFRHCKYLSYVLLSTLFCYCAAVIQSCKQRNKVDRSSYTKLKTYDSEELDEEQI